MPFGKVAVNLAPFLATTERVKSWLAELPADNPNVARKEIATALERLLHANNALTLDVINALVQLDEGCHPILTDVLRRYLTDNLSEEEREEIRSDMESIYGHLGHAYTRFVIGYHNARTSARPIAQLMALTIARGLNALTNQAKWAYFNRDAAPASCWEQIHALFEYAEFNEIEGRTVTLYSRPLEIVTSCAGLYCRSVLLSSLNSGVFAPRHIETTDHWLTAWTPNSQVYTTYAPEAHFYAGILRSNEVPTKVHENVESPYARYIRTDNIALEIQRAATRVKQGAAQHEMGFIATQPLGEAAELLDRLSRLWSPEIARSNQRTNQRVAVDNEAISVVRGLNGICESARQDYERAHGTIDLNRGLTREEEMDLQVYGFITERTRSKLRARPLDATQPIPALEGWTLQNESIVGFGASFPTGTYRDPVAEVLVGIKRRKSERWGVGSVVRVRTNRITGETLVGIEIISLSPVIVTLGDNLPEAELRTSQLSWGMFLPEDAKSDMGISLLIDTAAYTYNRIMIMGARNVRYSIRLGHVMRTGERWSRVGLEVLEKRG